MKAKNTLLIGLGLISATAFAQSSMSSGDQSHRQPNISSQPRTQSPLSSNNQSPPATLSSDTLEEQSRMRPNISSQTSSQTSQTQRQSQPQSDHQTSSATTSGKQPSDTASGMEASDQSQDTSPAIPPAPPVAQLAPKTENAVTYLCGGVGVNEASYMKKAARDYDLMLTFATRRGNYLADVAVDIADAQGKSVLQTSCDAPILLVDFPKSGSYHIHAQAGNYQLNKVANVKVKGHNSLVLLWPQQVAQGTEEASQSSGQ